MSIKLTNQTISIIKISSDAKYIIAVDLDGKIILIQTFHIHKYFKSQLCSNDDLIDFWTKNICTNQFEYSIGIFDDEILNKYSDHQIYKNITNISPISSTLKIPNFI